MARVALVTNILASYRVACFRELARGPHDVRFFLLSEGMKHRSYVQARESSGLDVQVLPGLSFRRGDYDNVHLSDPRPLARWKPGVLILGGWAEPAYLTLYAWARLRRVPVLFWIESTLHDRERSSAKEAFKRMLLAGSAGAIVPGKRSSEYCSALGLPPERIFVAPNAADREYFAAKATELLPRRQQLRERLGLDGTAVLFVGRLVEEFKGVSVLLEAARDLERRAISVTVLLAGDGPGRGHYEAMAQRLADVRFLGVLDRERLAEYYAAADLLVLPSRSEPWGFVLNEGMEFGLPLVVSTAVGAAADLVADGVNGIVVQAGDAAGLAASIAALVADGDALGRFGRQSRRRVESYDPAAWAAGVRRAVAEVCARAALEPEISPQGSD